MTEIEANKALEKLLNQGIFEDANVQFVGVFQSEENISNFEIRQGVHNLSKVPSISSFFERTIGDRFKLQTNLKKKFFNTELPEESPNVKIIDTPMFKTLSFRSNALSCGAIGNYYGDDRLGTLGAFFRQNTSDDVFFISNWHVLVNENIKLGYAIIQPNGTNRLLLKDKIGKLHSYYLDEQMDVAIGKLNNGVRYNTQGQGITGLGSPKLGMTLVKQGAGSGAHPEGGAKILSVNCSVRVTDKNYPKIERIFHHQIMTNDMAAPLDSGSVSIDKSTHKAIGLVFADNGFKYTIHNPLAKVFDKKHPFMIHNGVNKGQTMPALDFKEFI